MIRTLSVGTVVATIAILGLPFLGGAGPSLADSTSARDTVSASDVTTTTVIPADTPTPVPSQASVDAVSAAVTAMRDADAATATAPDPVVAAGGPTVPTAEAAAAASVSAQIGTERVSGQAWACTSPDLSLDTAPVDVSPLGVAGASNAELGAFAVAYNQMRQANGLDMVPCSNFRHDQCMEQRLFWIAEDPSSDPASAWGHIGTQRSDGLPSVGCDGNLAGGMNNTPATVAVKWWTSTSHRASLYKPGTSVAGACIYFAMTHGGVPDEPYAFTRAAARWGSC